MTEEKNKEKGIALFKAEIQKEVMNNKEVFNALAQNTFKGLEPANIPQALLQGRMKGFELSDFMVGNVYAVPFYNKRLGKQEYSLVNSIEHVRKIAMRSGQSGSSEPKIEFTADGKTPISASVTVWRNGGDERGYTAKVYFTEYNTGKNLWVSKPITMIGKVAEMHALRKAFPEELQNVYVEEEYQKEHIIEAEAPEVVVDEKEVKEVLKKIKTLKSVKGLTDYFKTLKKPLNQSDEIISAFKEQKEKCQKEKTTK